MRRAYLIFALSLGVLGACATHEARNSKAPSPPLSGEKFATQSPPAQIAQDACQASRFRYLIGKKRSEIPPKPEAAVWRIACTSCAITMDLAPARLNIFFDEKTDVIKEVKCG
jgi:hypothetical protein